MEPTGLPTWLQIALLIAATISGSLGTFLFQWWRAFRVENRDDKKTDYEQRIGDKRLEHEQQLAEANLAFQIYKDVISLLKSENANLKLEIDSLRKELDEVKEKLFKIESCPTVHHQLNSK